MTRKAESGEEGEMVNSDIDAIMGDIAAAEAQQEEEEEEEEVLSEAKFQELIELVRNHKITPEERESQVRSFAYGNMHLHNPAITHEDIEKAADALRIDKEAAEASSQIAK